LYWGGKLKSQCQNLIFFSQQKLYDEYKMCTEEVEVLLQWIKSINLFSPVGCAGRTLEHFVKRNFNQHTMMSNLRNEFAVFSDNFNNEI
jgi:hypothetical protein